MVPGLLNTESRYNTLTQNQKTLLSRLAQGWSDQEIAKEAGVSVSTVRHQKFVFREKAKQARVYLALYECAEQLAEAATGNGNSRVRSCARCMTVRKWWMTVT